MNPNNAPKAPRPGQQRHRSLLAFGLLFIAASILGVTGIFGSIPALTPSPSDPPEVGFQGEGADRLAVEREVLLLTPPGISERPTLQDLEVLVDGNAAHKTDLRRLEKGAAAGASSWHFEVYLDPVLSTRSGMQQAFEWLDLQAESLTRMGEVRIVVAEPFAETALEATRDPAAIRETLELYSDLIEAAGELEDQRAAFRRPGQGRQELDPGAALNRELNILADHLGELAGWLASGDSRAPRCLIVAQEAVDLSPGIFYAGSGATQTNQEAQLVRRVGQLLAVTGWTVVGLEPRQVPDELFPAARSGVRVLAEATGGMVASSREELASVLSALQGAQRLRVTVAGASTGEPSVLEVRSSAPGQRVLAPRWISAATPLWVSAARAGRFLDEPDDAEGPLPTEAILRPDPAGAARPGMMAALLEVALNLKGIQAVENPHFRVTMALTVIDDPPSIGYEQIRPGSLSGMDRWQYRQAILVPEDMTQGVVIIEELQTGLWGAAALEISNHSLESGGRRVAEWNAPRRSSNRGSSASATSGKLIRLLPPRRQPVTGKVRIDTLGSDPRVAQVEFFLDDKKVAEDSKPPFRAVFDFGSEAQPHVVRVDALSGDNRRLGSHEIRVNDTGRSFEVRIRDIEGNPSSGKAVVTANVSTPAGRRLDRVEFYWNEELAATLNEEPLRAELTSASPGTQDYVRVVAYLDDGSSLEDAVLLDPQSLSELVVVNLVELNVIVSDRTGQVIRGLQPEDFRIKVGGERRTVDRFALAGDVPLVLGLVIDTSESMWALMTDTKKAGAQFLGATIGPLDHAFLVDFDSKPRLAQATTGDLLELFSTFNSLEPEGLTAVYDAIIFSMLQFEEAEGRKALVLLTDGDDVQSRYGPRRCIQYGKQLGVPVYILSLAGIQNPRRALRKIDLESVTKGTGGDIFYITQMDQLDEAYAQINEELRSQYILSFSTERALEENELRKIKVEVAGEELSARTVVAGQQSQ
ncbi:MAG: VWA domain-containing protein [Bacteroidia bacterium]|nr:VWA domain-containing protein [Bacteroidia bacterium]